jgi:hypothetical protein
MGALVGPQKCNSQSFPGILFIPYLKRKLFLTFPREFIAREKTAKTNNNEKDLITVSSAVICYLPS